MRKQKNLISLITLLLFAMTMMVPMAANAAETEVTFKLGSPREVEGGETFPVTGAVTGELAEKNTLFLMSGESAYEGTFSTDGKTVMFANVVAPEATYADGTMELYVVEAENVDAAKNIAEIDAIASFNITVKALEPEVTVSNPNSGDREVDVQVSGLENEDVTLTLTGGGLKVDPVTVDFPTDDTATFEIDAPGFVAGTTYTVTMAYNDGKDTKEATFIPTAAGTNPGDPVADASRITVVDTAVEVDKDATVRLDIRDINDDEVAEGPYTIYVWAEETAGYTTTALRQITVESTDHTYKIGDTEVTDNLFHMNVINDDTLEMQFSRAGTYKVYAALEDPGNRYSQGTVKQFKSDSRTVNVSTEPVEAAVEIAGIGVEGAANEEILMVNKEVYGTDTLGTLLDGTKRVPFTAATYKTLFNEDFAPLTAVADGTTKTLIDFTVYQYVDTDNNGTIEDDERTLENIEALGADQEVTFTTDTGLTLNTVNATTDSKGQVQLAISAANTGKYNITAQAGGHIVTIPVEAVDPAEEPTPAKSVIMTIGSKTFIIDGKTQDTDVAPIIRHDRTYVPYRALAEAFGASVEWDEPSRSVTVEQGDDTVVMTIDSRDYTVNGVKHTMDVAPFIENSRTMIPVRFASEALGYEIDVTYHADGTTNQVLFNK